MAAVQIRKCDDHYPVEKDGEGEGVGENAQRNGTRNGNGNGNSSNDHIQANLNPMLRVHNATNNASPSTPGPLNELESSKYNDEDDNAAVGSLEPKKKKPLWSDNLVDMK